MRALVIFALFLAVQGSEDEVRLVRHLISRDADVIKLVRPVENNDDVLTIQFDLSVNDILIDNPRARSIVLKTWASMHWTDYRLQWDPEEYGGIRNVRLSADKIWTPDIELYNDVHDDGGINLDRVLALVMSDGRVVYVPPYTFHMECSQNASARHQECQSKFGSWTYNGLQVDLGEPSMDLSSLHWEDGYYHNLEHEATRNVVNYACCPESYVDVTFKISYQEGGE